MISKKKSRIRETPTLSTDADNRTDTNLKRLRDLSLKKKCSQNFLGVVPPPTMGCHPMLTENANFVTNAL